MSSSCGCLSRWVWSRNWFRLSLLAAGATVLAGCVERPAAAPSAASAAARSDTNVAEDDAANAPITYVLATGTVYYNGDPQHGHKTDGTLRRGTKVTLVHRSGNYSLVRSEDGIQGYVPTHILEPLAMQ